MVNIVFKASKSFSRPDTGSQGMAKIGSEANIASMSASLTSSTHSASAVNLVMTTSTPALTTKSNSAASAPTITVTNLVAVITDVQTVVAEVTAFSPLLTCIVDVAYPVLKISLNYSAMASF